MNKKFYGTLLLGTLLLGSTIVSCKDYDDDIDNLQNQITQLATKADMQSEVSKLQSAVATAQAAAENKAAAAEQAAKDAAAKAQAAADAAAKAQGTADAAATVEALEKVAAEAAAAAKAAEEAKVAAETKAAELAAQLAELQALAATLVSTEDFEAAKKELNDKYAELAAKIGETTGVTGMTGINLVNAPKVKAGYGEWAGVHNGLLAAEWDGPKAEEVNAIEKGTKLAAWGALKDIAFSVNPTDFDASKIEAFAIVNQFDEVAPIAFGTPKAVTRAAAGAWTLPVLGGVIKGSEAESFKANFTKDQAKGVDGTVATLVAGQFAGALESGNCEVTENKNSSTTTFKAEIPYEAVDGVAELKAADPSVVYDAYISVIKAKMASATIAHDSVVYKLAYTGTTLTYDAAAVKKLLDSNPKTEKFELTVAVKQINLNGYIHTDDAATITFFNKEAAKPVEVETVTLSTPVDHQVAINVLDKSNGKKTDVQKIENISLNEALTAWGIDLSKKNEESTIHWMHSNIKSYKFDVEKSYYLGADNMPVYVKNLVKTDGDTKIVKDDKTGKLSANIRFTADYKHDDWNKTGVVDAAWSGKLIYVPATFTVEDTDNGDTKTTIYSVVIPVQFQAINASQYYNWNANKLQSAEGKIEFTVPTPTSPATTPANWSEILNIRNQFNAVAGSDVKLTTADTTQVFDETTPTTWLYNTPALTLSGALSIKEYTDAKAKINALVEGKTAGENGYSTTYSSHTSTTKVDKEFKDKEIAVLDELYKNAVVIGTTSATTTEHFLSYSQYNWNSADKCADTWNEILVCDPTYRGSRVWMAKTNTGFKDYKTDDIVLVYTDKAKTACLNAEYAVNGLKVEIAGRTVDAPLSVKIAYNAPTTAPTFTTTAKLSNTANASIVLSNSARTPLAGEWDGQFTLKNVSGKTLELVDVTSAGTTTTPTITVGTITDTEGTPISGFTLTADVVKYDYATGVSTYGIQFTMGTTTLPAGAEKKIKVPMTINQTDLVGMTTTPVSTSVTFTLELQ